MFVDGRISHEACNEAYCLLSAYIREEKIKDGIYDVDKIKTFALFLADILKYPENFLNEPKNEKKVSEKEKKDGK